MPDLNDIPREFLYCRAWQHSWDHRGDDQPDITRVVRGNLTFWFTTGRCTSCGTQRTRYFHPKTCAPYTNWGYVYQPEWKVQMHNVSQTDARQELARRARTSTRTPRVLKAVEAS